MAGLRIKVKTGLLFSQYQFVLASYAQPVFMACVLYKQLISTIEQFPAADPLCCRIALACCRNLLWCFCLLIHQDQ